MNPTDPLQPINPTPTGGSSLPPVPPLQDDSQENVANVARSQIDQIFGVDGAPNATLSHNSQQQPMINQPASQPPPAVPEVNGTPQPAPTEPNPNQPTTTPDSTPPPVSPEDAHQRYHSAWQEYYQKYYEKYYISAMEQQNQAYNQQLATIHLNAKVAATQAAQSVADGTMTQKEAIEEMRQDILAKVKRGAGKVRKSRHFVPAVAALLVILASIFIQYNGLIFAKVNAFISPGATSGQDIIIGAGGDEPVGPDPRVIIPKINVNAPVIYGLTDLSEASSQRALQDGTIHYPIQGASAFPGQNGNTVILGHSSADFFEPGNFKFIFVQLNRLTVGDLFYLDYKGVRYTYQIRETKIINPNEIGTLAIGEDKPYATLITCDPPGTARQRLIVIGDQISPDPSQATTTQNPENEVKAQGTITGTPPTLFERIFGGG